MSAQLSAMRGIEVRQAAPTDMAACLSMRKAAEREFVVSGIEVDDRAVWWVAEANGHDIVACVSFIVGGQSVIVVLDAYDDGTREGKRGLSALIKEFFGSGCKLSLVVPFDRPGFVRALERRGATVKATVLEYP